jgi:hypothetical protein
MTQYYAHTQFGKTMMIIAGVVFIIGLWSISTHGGAASMLILLIALGLAFMFPTLTVLVGPEALQLSMGAGLIKKSFPLADIRSAHAVQNPWYYGFGIRWFPGGWLFNVSGPHAVEIEMASGKKYRIGTDEPDKLLKAIQDNTQI